MHDGSFCSRLLTEPGLLTGRGCCKTAILWGLHGNRAADHRARQVELTGETVKGSPYRKTCSLTVALCSSTHRSTACVHTARCKAGSFGERPAAARVVALASQGFYSENMILCGGIPERDVLLPFYGWATFRDQVVKAVGHQRHDDRLELPRNPSTQTAQRRTTSRHSIPCALSQEGRHDEPIQALQLLRHGRCTPGGARTRGASGRDDGRRQGSNSARHRLSITRGL